MSKITVVNYTGDKEKIKEMLPDMFNIIHKNMDYIMPTGNSREEDKIIWTHYMEEELSNPNKRWLFAFDNNRLCGYMLYTINNAEKSVNMDEIQLKKENQQDGITFCSLFGDFLNNKEMQNIEYLYSYTNKQNLKAQAILNCLGLEVIEEKKNGFKYKGNRVNASKWFNQKYCN